MALPYQAFADAVLIGHFSIVLFVVLGLPAIVLGNQLGWRWVNRRGWRLAHLVAIATVALQAWLGRYCPLTLWENALREKAGQAPYQSSFIQHWVGQIVYHDAPLWVFALLYTGFALMVAWAWWRYPPGRPRA